MREPADWELGNSAALLWIGRHSVTSPLQSKVWPKSSGWNCVFGSEIASGRL